MVKVIMTDAMEKKTAIYLVKIGRANAEQQKLAYRALTERKPHRPKNITKEERRTFVVHSILHYMKEAGEPMSHNAVYDEVAAMEGIKKDTVRRPYEQFLLLGDEEKKRLLDKVRRSFLYLL